MISVSNAKKAGVLTVLPVLKRHIAEHRPLSLVRLGDGEGRLLGFPEIIGKTELDFSLQIWFGRTDFDLVDLTALAVQLRDAVLAADIVGLPRPEQAKVPEWQAIFTPLERFGLLANAPLLTHTAIHRYLQMGLFYRDLLDRLPFCGLITCRDLAAHLARVFRIGHVEQHLIPGEVKYPGPFQGNHFPTRFLELKETLTVPFRGAVFLVGAGALGKIYCHWIKQLGGIALDIGSMCDAWEGTTGRLRKPCHRLEIYEEIPPLSLPEAVQHYNQMILRDKIKLDPLTNLPR